MRLVDADQLKTELSNRDVRFKDHDELERFCNILDECTVECWGNKETGVSLAIYVMMLHKEFGVSLKKAAKAHEVAREYLANHSECRA